MKTFGWITIIAALSGVILYQQSQRHVEAQPSDPDKYQVISYQVSSSNTFIITAKGSHSVIRAGGQGNTSSIRVGDTLCRMDIGLFRVPDKTKSCEVNAQTEIQLGHFDSWMNTIDEKATQ